MPRGNGMGPNGLGPMTGRGAGYCAGNGLPGYALNGGRGFGRGMGQGMGFGRGFGRGRGFGPAPSFQPVGGRPSAEAEKWNLERQAEFLEEELKAIRGRLESLGTAPEAAPGGMK